jgi:hypothetical protein
MYLIGVVGHTFLRDLSRLAVQYGADAQLIQESSIAGAAETVAGGTATASVVAAAGNAGNLGAFAGSISAHPTAVRP